MGFRDSAPLSDLKAPPPPSNRNQTHRQQQQQQQHQNPNNQISTPPPSSSNYSSAASAYPQPPPLPVVQRQDYIDKIYAKIKSTERNRGFYEEFINFCKIVFLF